MKEKNIQAHGAFIGVLQHADGTVETIRKDNLVLKCGIDFLCDAAGKASGRPGVMSHIAIGTGTTSAADYQTQLVTESVRKAATYAHTAGTSKMTFSATFNEGEGTGALTEAGICNAAYGGTFFDRVVFAVLNKAADDIFTANFEITFTK